MEFEEVPVVEPLPAINENSQRILIVTIGSRGDCQPYLAIGLRLIAAGHAVALVTCEAFKDFVEENGPGIDFFPLPGIDPSKIIQSQEFEDAFYSNDKQKQMSLLFNATKEYIYPGTLALLKHCETWKPTCIVSSFINLGESLAIGQKYLIPVMAACTVPIYPSKETLPIGFLEKPFKQKWLNSFLSWALWKVQWALVGGDVNRFRREVLKLPEVDNLGMDSVPLIYMFSSAVVPKNEDTPPHVVYSGYWILPPKQGYQPPEDLQQFLDGLEKKPVYLGFGSMPVKNKPKVLEMFSNALKKEGLHGIFCGGWSTVSESDIPENIKFVKECPHEWLLPQCCMAFHHGGAGTTAASMRAGIPTIILPVLVDQPFWAAKIVSLRIGQASVCPLKDITTDYIHQQIKYCLTPDIIANAAEFGRKLRSEDGNFVGASYIESYAIKKKNPGYPPINYLPDSATEKCLICSAPFKLFFRRHHCVTCGTIACEHCVKFRDITNYDTFRYCCKNCHQARGWDFDQ